MHNVLDLADQTVFLAEQATGATSLVQCAWIYDSAVDLEGLRRFHHHLQNGRLSRRIERSALPFGRHRWVAATGATALEVSAPRPRAEVESWLRTHANTPLDCVHGTGWHLAVLPFTGGGAALSLVISHTLTDGVGLCAALADAARGHDGGTAWPAAASRTRWRALREDLGQSIRDLPSVAHALRSGARMRGPVRPGAARSARRATHDEPIILATAGAFIDIDDWDARARALGGSPNTLLAGIAADIARRHGRLTAEHAVALSIPVDGRVEGDTRANAVSNIDVLVNPSTTDLRPTRAAIKQALICHQDLPDAKWELLPLTPLLPKWLVRKMVRIATGTSATVVSSNLGDIDPEANRPDGTDADVFTMRSLYPGVTRATMDGVGGVLALLSGRVNGRVFISALADLPGQAISDADLQEAVSASLDAFALPVGLGVQKRAHRVDA